MKTRRRNFPQRIEKDIHLVTFRRVSTNTVLNQSIHKVCPNYWHNFQKLIHDIVSSTKDSWIINFVIWLVKFMPTNPKGQASKTLISSPELTKIFQANNLLGVAASVCSQRNSIGISLSTTQQAKGRMKSSVLDPVVQKVDSAIHRINYYPVDGAISFRNTYPLDSDLSSRQRYPTFEQPWPGAQVQVYIGAQVFGLPRHFHLLFV